MSFALDPSFNGVGWETSSFASPPTSFVFSSANAVVLQTIGGETRAVAIGFAGTFRGGGVVTVRYRSSGALDTSFGDGQTPGLSVEYPNGLNGASSGSAGANAAILQTGNSILVAGSFTKGITGFQSEQEAFIFQYTSNGLYQNEIYINNLYTHGTTGSSDLQAFAPQSDNKIVAVGTGTDPSGSTSAILVARLNPNLTADASFGSSTAPAQFVSGQGGGIGFERIGVDGTADAVVVQPATGKIVVAGTQSSGGGALLMQLNQNGSLDRSFGGQGTGLAATGLPASNTTITSIALEPVAGDSKVVVAGQIGGTGQYFVARYNSNGTPDTSFGSHGRVVSKFLSNGLPGSSGIAALKIQTDGKIVVAGSVTSGNSVPSAVVARFNTDGSLDTSFAPNGQVTTDFGGKGGQANGLAIQGDGKIVIDGTSSNQVGEAGDFAIARFANTTPAAKPPVDFDGDGKADVAVFQPSTSTFYVIPSGNIAVPSYAVTFGQGTLYGGNPVPVPAAYGGGVADIAVFQPSTSTFSIIPAANPGHPFAIPFGQGTLYGGDPIPVVADYDGDGVADIAVFQPSTSTFYVMPSSNPSHPYAVTFGQGTLYGGSPVPVAADYAGAGKAQVAVFQPSTSTFYIQGVGAVPFGQGTLYGGDPYPIPLPTAYRVGGVLVERSVGGGTATGSLTTRSAAGFEPMVTADAPGSIPPVVILLPGPGDATSGPATKSSATPTARIHVVAIDGSVS
ncbi:MAG TPA: hypothetical protein VG406_05125 [Isosphaeraceae bacterium]|nr:hypothetical protein [Isosphaeraceae bacterium]